MVKKDITFNTFLIEHTVHRKTPITKPCQHTAKHDNYGCNDNPKQNMTTLAVCDTSYTFSMKPDNRQQNMTTTAVKTKT